MKLTKQDIARLIDMSAVQAQDSDQTIRSLVKCARKYHIVAVITLPSQIKFTREILGEGSRVLLGGSAGFPAAVRRPQSRFLKLANKPIWAEPKTIW